MSSLPTVSIVIPSYNKQAYIKKAIESALAQTHECEVIVVDDGSTDGSLEVVKSYDGRIKWEAGQNRGGSAARNRGLDLASGDYIQFLDADDILPPEKVAKQIAQLSDASPDDIAFSPWSYMYDDGTISRPNPRPYWRTYRDGLSLLIDMWYLGGFFPPHTWLASRALIDKVGRWDEALTGDDDGEFFGRLLAESGRAQFCDQTCVLYRDPPDGSVSRSRSLKSARSDWVSFENVAHQITSRRSDRMAQKACLSRVRVKAYAWRRYDEIVEKASSYEAQLDIRGFSPALPPTMRYLVGLVGIKHGLKMRHLIKGGG